MPSSVAAGQSVKQSCLLQVRRRTARDAALLRTCHPRGLGAARRGGGCLGVSRVNTSAGLPTLEPAGAGQVRGDQPLASFLLDSDKLIFSFLLMCSRRFVGILVALWYEGGLGFSSAVTTRTDPPRGAADRFGEQTRRLAALLCKPGGAGRAHRT